MIFSGLKVVLGKFIIFCSDQSQILKIKNRPWKTPFIKWQEFLNESTWQIIDTIHYNLS